MYTTDAIVLKKMDVGEHDALYMLYTHGYGKMRAVASGIKKPEAKLRGHLEPLSLSRVRFVLGKNREKLIGASMLNFWHGIREDVHKLSLAHYIASRIDRECMEGQKDEALWNLLTQNFSLLNGHDNFGNTAGTFINDFERDLQSALGYGDTGEGMDREASSGAQRQQYAIMSV